MSDEDTIIPIGVKFRDPPDDQKMLTIVNYRECEKHSYFIDQEAGTCICSKCKKQFDPMYVLVELAHQESRWYESYERSVEASKQYEEKKRTKCEHCHKITGIKRP